MIVMTRAKKKEKSAFSDANTNASQPIKLPRVSANKRIGLERRFPRTQPMQMTDAQWDVLRQLPEMGRTYSVGRRPTDNREVLEAVLWVMRNRARWQDLPSPTPSPRTCQRRLRRWQEDGAWSRIWSCYLGTLNEVELRRWAELFADVYLSGETNTAGELIAESRIGRPPFWWSMAQAYWHERGQSQDTSRDQLIHVFVNDAKDDDQTPGDRDDHEAA